MRLLPILFLAAAVLGCSSPADLEPFPSQTRSSDTPDSSINITIDTAWTDTIHLDF